MKLAGFLLLVAGWLLALAAVILLAERPAGSIFVCWGIGVELLGMVLVFRSHLVRGEHET